MKKVNVGQKLAQINEHWKPRVAAELNGQMVKLVKFKGEFVWHHHVHEDEMFFVVKGSFEMHFEESVERVSAGEFIVVPHGVEHKPYAAEECEVILFEPASTLNTGNAENELTLHELERI